ncbi:MULTISPECIES: AbrB/MazE/SpoVT family DNA-binding domain-containing protein [unclassified Aureimonas]|uniref:AbrB/MazE/SpoVT family DNA-binding domain-containing protein n=1 Tax=unclassified Aureimonas TaxID=2615206 RepID=UPI0009EADC01|nr:MULTISPECIES: AbrB/MazE/SpoVT family DNA-binding domain-containing protein [unclassified Aureimonas]
MSAAETVTDVRISANGRMVLPLAVRKAMGLSGEARVIVTVEGDEVRLSPIKHVVTRLQGLYREHAKNDADTEAFLEERRRDEGADH